MEIIEVGKPYTRIVGKPEACYADNTGVFEIIVNYKHPTNEEINAYKANKKFEIRFFSTDNVLFFLFRAEGEPWQDAPFNPHLSPNKEYEEIKDGEGYLLTLIVSDAPSGVVKSIRSIGLGNKFSNALRKQIVCLMDNPFDADLYRSDIERIYGKYSTEELLRFTSAETRYRVDAEKNI